MVSSISGETKTLAKLVAALGGVEG